MSDCSLLYFNISGSSPRTEWKYLWSQSITVVRIQVVQVLLAITQRNEQCMFALWVNVGVAMVVSLLRRKFRQSAIQLALGVVCFFIYAVAIVFSWCVPTRMATSPGEGLIQECICKPTHIERSQLVFLGGIDTREWVVVFEVIGELPPSECFTPGSGYGNVDKARAGDNFRALMKAIRVAVELPEEFDVSSYHDEKNFGILQKLSAGGKTYLVYKRL